MRLLSPIFYFLLLFSFFSSTCLRFAFQAFSQSPSTISFRNVNRWKSVEKNVRKQIVFAIRNANICLFGFGHKRELCYWPAFVLAYELKVEGFEAMGEVSMANQRERKLSIIQCLKNVNFNFKLCFRVDDFSRCSHSYFFTSRWILFFYKVGFILEDLFLSVNLSRFKKNYCWLGNLIMAKVGST